MCYRRMASRPSDIWNVARSRGWSPSTCQDPPITRANCEPSSTWCYGSGSAGVVRVKHAADELVGKADEEGERVSIYEEAARCPLRGGSNWCQICRLRFPAAQEFVLTPKDSSALNSRM